MNSDSSFNTDILDVYRKYIENNDCMDIAVLSPQFNYDRHVVKKYSGTRQIRYAMMSGNFVNSGLFLKVKGFKEQFFVDGLDTEFCLKVKKRGFKIIECGEAILNHNPGETKKIEIFGRIIFKYGIASPKRYFYQARSLIWITLKYRSFRNLCVYFYKIFKIIFLFPNKKEYIKSFVNGSKEGISLLKKEGKDD